MERIPQGAARRQVLKAYLASDHVTAATGKTLAVVLSKNGGAFANPHAGATNATEIANGWYYVDLDATDTGTLGPLTIRATASGVDDVETLLTVVDPLVALSPAGYQQIAREVHGCRGTVWHVATGGNDASDGLSWATAKASPKATVESASAGDLVLLGDGTFALGNTGIHLPADVSMRGAGSQRTILTSTADYNTSPILGPGNRSRINDILVRGLAAAGTTQYPISDSLGACADVILDGVEIDCDADGLRFGAADTSVLMRHSAIRTKYDAVFCQHAKVDVFNSMLLVNGPSSTSSGDIAHGVNLLGATGRVRLFDSHIDVRGANTTTQGVHAAFGALELHGCTIHASSATGDGKAIVQENMATILAVGCQYDRSKTSGTIIDVARIMADAAGNAHAVVGQNERQLLADALLDRGDGIETGITPRQAMRIMAAVLVGKVTGAGSGIERFQALDGVTPRVEVAADALGNRSSVSYTVD